MDQFETLEIVTGPDRRAEPAASVIWMHGLGADAHDFEPLVPLLDLGPDLVVRYVFPNAPVRPVTVNGGVPMRAWNDLFSLDRDAPEDEAGIRASSAAIGRLIEQEIGRGTESRHIVLAGFSQGGAMALFTALRFPMPLAGIIALSTYLPLAGAVAEERHPANSQIPILMAHGEIDDVVAINYGRSSRRRLHDMGFDVDWRVYPMGHSVIPEQIPDIREFLLNTLRGAARTA